MPESLVFSDVKIFFLYFLLFGALRSIPTHYFLVCLLFVFYSMLAYKHNDLQAPSRHQKRYRCLIIMLVYRRLLTKCLQGKAAVSQQITFEKQRNLFIQGYNHMYLAIHFIMKHTLYNGIYIISRVQASLV